MQTKNALDESKWVFAEGTFTAGVDFIVGNGDLDLQPFVINCEYDTLLSFIFMRSIEYHYESIEINVNS